MPDLLALIEFLEDAPLYQHEKPFVVLPRAAKVHDPDSQRLKNVTHTSHEVCIKDMRELDDDVTLEEAGFCAKRHVSKYLQMVETIEGMERYKEETRTFLKEMFPEAEEVYVWDFRLRKNIHLHRTTFDMNDPLLIEGPAKGAHIDATVNSGPAIIERHLPADIKAKVFKPGCRFRIINTWRPLNKKVEDRPLALCSFKSIDPQDLIPIDRVYPTFVGEVYGVLYNPKQQWYWLSDQTAEEIFVMIMYDTHPDAQARYCPHASFENPSQSAEAPARASVETRSIVISRL